MKKLFVTLLILTGALAIHAYEYPYLAFKTASGITQTVSVESLVITFSDGQLVATNNEGRQTFALNELSKMFFSEKNTTTGISTMETADESLEAFTIGGLFVGKFDTPNEAKSHLKSGVYVLKSKNKTRKITIK
jgi:hypothetical protein